MHDLVLAGTRRAPDPHQVQVAHPQCLTQPVEVRGVDLWRHRDGRGYRHGARVVGQDREVSATAEQEIDHARRDT